jgi:para-aminobenzoate N-oxygenase AurF
MPTPAEPPAPFRRSKPGEWDAGAAVRTKPRRRLSEGADEDLYFSPTLVPIARHPLVAALGPQAVRRTLIEHLYTHLAFTARLEHDCVNAVLRRIASGRVGIGVPQQMRLDAYRLYCDEAYHALFSADLASQVEAVTGIAPGDAGPPAFIRCLRRVRASRTPALRRIADMLFVVVSETLISGTLKESWRDARVVTVVREVLGDHAEDEERHHVYFSAFFELLWRQLTPGERASVGPLLPGFIHGFLSPDRAAITAGLVRCGVRPADTAQVLGESYPEQTVLAEMREASRLTRRLFARNGVLEDPATADAFAATGLVDVDGNELSRRGGPEP